MHHFFVDKENILNESGKIIIEGQDAKHIAMVLRMEKGEKITISSGQGDEYCCIITDIAKNRVVTDIESELKQSRELQGKIYVMVGMPKADKLEDIIQKTVELGAYAIIPVISERTIVKVDKNKIGKKVSRWNEIAKSAAKQSKRQIIPQVMEPILFKDIFDEYSDINTKIIAYEEEKDVSYMHNILESIEKGESVAVLVGPEGGFEEHEVETAKENGYKCVSLGKRILRVQTAAVLLAGLVMMTLER